MVCVDIPEINGTTSYCQVFHTWEPRVTSPLVWILPGLIAFTVLVFSMLRQYISAPGPFWDDRQAFAFTHLRHVLPRHLRIIFRLNIYDEEPEAEEELEFVEVVPLRAEEQLQFGANKEIQSRADEELLLRGR